MQMQQSTSLARRWPGRARAVILAVLVLAAVLDRPVGAVDNGGLGPLSIRNQFPVTLAFLTYTPDAPLTLPEATFQFRYQYALTNTFINTQSPIAGSSTVIQAADVARPGGLVKGDFPASGYGLYIDVEAARHLFRFDYGLTDSLEVGLELAWVTFGGGFLDDRIEGVEKAFGGLNEDRLFSDQDRFDFYVIRDGTFLRRSSQAFSQEPLDPVVNLKWNLGEGGDVLPALSIKLSYKVPLKSNPTGPRQLISSGRADFGYYFLLSKAVGDVVGHFQIGTTELDVAANTFADRLKHRMFGLEFRIDMENSLVLQSVTQTSIFIDSDDPAMTDFAISRQTDVLVLGYKRIAKGFLFELGTIEDYNQQRNESDITFFIEVGWQW